MTKPGDQTYWLKQDVNDPLFKDLIWSRPETKAQAGKLLIIGGSANNFAQVNLAYSQSMKGIIGRVRLILPDSLQKTLSSVAPSAQFAASNPSGGFGLGALAHMLEECLWADGVLLPGELGKNSETTLLIESLLTKYSGVLTLANDAVDLVLAAPETIITRPNTVLVMTLSQLQKLAKATKNETAITTKMSLAQLVNALHDFTLKNTPAVILNVEGESLVAFEGKISTTKQTHYISTTATATTSCIWCLQNPNNLFESISSSVVEA